MTTTCVIFLIIITATSTLAQEYMENYYCGMDNCYDLLQVTRENTKNDIKRAFRQIAGKTHPDKFLDPDEKKIALEKFKKLQTAYDVLRDDATRADYDYLLDHPDEYYMNYYRAWRRRVAPNVDIRIVIAVTISLISLVQYYNGYTKYDEAIKYFATVPKYRLQAVELAKEEGLLSTDNNNKKKIRGLSKEEIRKQDELVIRQIIENKMDIQGVYAKPTLYDILWVQMILLPVWGVQYSLWYIRWVWKFYIKNEDYGDLEKYYIIRRNMCMSQGQFDALEECAREEYLEQMLWLPEKFSVWKEKKDIEIKKKQNQSGRYKSYKRYLRKHGPERMYFDDS